MSSKWKISVPGLLACLGGLVSLWQAARLYRFRTGLWIGDHVFPGLVGLGLLAAGLLLLFLRRTEPVEEKAERVKPEDLKRVAAIPAVLLGYALILPWSGYLLGTGVAALLLYRLIGGYAWWKCLLAAILTAVCLQLVFVHWLQTPLPAGKLIRL